MTSRAFAVVGDPIAQSLSPTIHKAAYEALGLDWTYEAFLVSSGGLKDFLETHTELSGISVTMPLKFEATEIATPGHKASRTLGVTNTLLKTNTGYIGFNTDVFGMQKATEALKNIASIVVMGSGATARTAVYAMQEKFPEAEVLLMARNESSAKELGSMFGISTASLPTSPIEADLVINTVPGVRFETAGTTLQAAYSVDESLPYNFISGVEMLLWQAIAQIRIFINGSAETALPNELQILQRMRLAISHG